MRAALKRFARRIRDTRFGMVLRKIYHTPVIYFLFNKLLKLRFGFTAVVGLEPRRASDRGPAPEADQEQLRRRYRQSAEAGQEDTFVLYRIIGNDLVPRHKKGQSRENLRFILEHEPDLQSCEKRFVLNRIIDAGEEAAVMHLLDSYGMPFIRIPFSEQEYAGRKWDLEGLPEPGYTLSKQYDELPDDFRGRLYKRLYRHKNNYLINNNGARNAALSDGKDRAKWVLPWDGNCFLTREAWEEIRATVTARPWYPYVIVPMARVVDHAPILEEGFRPVADQEPQIIFRRDSDSCFDEDYYYGRRPKVEFLWRLGVPGPWDEWAIEPWDLPYPEYGPDAGAWQKAGWVVRLPSGSPNLEIGAGHETRRLDVRTEAVTSFLQKLDAKILAGRITLGSGLFTGEMGSFSESIEDADEADGRFSALWTEIQDTVLRRSRRESRGSRHRAEQLLLSYRQLPIVLDTVSKGACDKEAGQLLEWLQGDAGARWVRRSSSSAGTLHYLFSAMLALYLGRYDVLSHLLMLASDRAAFLFSSTDANNGYHEISEDEVHLFAWKGLDRLASACGENLWQAVSRPVFLERPKGDVSLP